MIGNKKVLAVIPARGGSKGIPRKNITEVAGRPLIAWTIEAAKKSQFIDRLILSSEDDEIIAVAKQWGCEVPFRRPIELAQDDTPGIDPVIHAVDALPGFDYVVLLQPTSPLRTAEDIDQCIKLCFGKEANSCVSVSEPNKSPYWMYSINPQGTLESLLPQEKLPVRRQECPVVYALNGAVYVADSRWLLQKRNFLSDETLAYVMPTERAIDIDNKADLLYAEYYLLN